MAEYETKFTLLSEYMASSYLMMRTEKPDVRERFENLAFAIT